MINMNHIHITLKNISIVDIKEAAKLIKGKVTTIDLWKNKHHQIDRMITKYGNSFNNDIELLKEKGYNVLRYKIEQTVSLKDFLDGSDCLYPEAHIKCNKDIGEIEGFVKSKNLDEHGFLFYNIRSNDKDVLSKGLEKLKPVIVTEQYELVLKDTNYDLDKWWA